VITNPNAMRDFFGVCIASPQSTFFNTYFDTAGWNNWNYCKLKFFDYSCSLLRAEWGYNYFFNFVRGFPCRPLACFTVFLYQCMFSIRIDIICDIFMFVIMNLSHLAIPSSAVLEGNLSVRQMKLIQAWIELHHDDLMARLVSSYNGSDSV
jgi:hypothetical protein